MPPKDLDTRLRECCEVRARLRDAGLLVLPELDRGLRDATDAFVRHARDANVSLRGPGGTRVRLRLAADGAVRSGVSIESTR
jgi:hypothetical protein